MSPVLSCRRIAIAAVATVATLASTAGPSLAAAPAAGCRAAATSNPFAPWGDQADYQLAPGGDVEDAGSSWTLSGDASAREGNETFMVTSPTDHRSLRIAGAGSATTDAMCVGIEHTHFRFFVKRSGGSALSRLAVEVVVQDARGRDRALLVGLVSGSGSWAPSSQLPVLVNLLAPLSGNAIDVAFRFRPMIGDGVWWIDDVYVDPYRTH